MSDIPHEILPLGAELQLQVAPEIYALWEVRWRFVDPAFAHKQQWRSAEHLSWAEAEDVIAAVTEIYQADMEAQRAF
uniref:Uncharacterized protein n=1 Tax=uncultured prokaryote TaxID=198431 RepID=A0A0H5Q8B0_9ZZZZ|nr:hypothetical protein [uncultured prokaryote]